jgi:hypothetical protein
MSLPEQGQSYLQYDTQPQVVYPVTIGQARDFISRIVQEEFVWRELLASETWGWHLHRAILRIALTEGPLEDVVDIIPLYVEECIKNPHYINSNDTREKIAQVALEGVRDKASQIQTDYEEGSYDVVGELEAAFIYSGRSGLSPHVMYAFDPETNNRLRDKYFFWHDSHTKERLEPLQYPEYVNSPIPDPNQDETA